MLQPPDTTNVSPYVPSVDPIAPLRAALRGHYDIEREIGQGAFATVYLARDLKHERKVALKVLNADPTSDTGELRFIREIRTLARLQHPNILPLHDSGHVEALLYYVMPYVSGDTLRDRIDREKQMPVEAACSIARDVADALAYAHGQGIVHRDIKPENILLSTGHPILADFGIARAIDLAGVRQLTKTGAASPGTPAYMSPEQLMGDKDVDGRSDTYSLGCVLFEMLTGKPPFAGKEGFVKRFTEPPPKASTFRKGLPAWVDEAIAGALQRAPQDRYATPREFIAALCAPTSGADVLSDSRARSFSGEGGIGAHLPTRGSTLDGSRGWTSFSLFSNHRALATLAGALAAILLIAGGLLARDRWGQSANAPVNRSRIVVFPLRGDRGTGGRIAKGMADALTGWKDLSVVSDLEISDGQPANRGVPASLRDAKAIARNLGAGSLLWGEVIGSGDSAGAKIEAYDVSGGGSTTPRTTVLPRDGLDPGVYSHAAISLLRDPARPPAADGGERSTNSFTALTAYDAAHASLARWDLSETERGFRSALANDPSFSASQLWLGQLLSWMKPEKSEWRDLARRAVADSPRLVMRDRLLAVGLAAMAEERYPDACAAYAQLIARAPRDFAGQYGLGECRSYDPVVLPDHSGPSGWKFRSSTHSAVAAYMKAFRIEPGAYALFTGPKLEKLLPIGSTVARPGRSTTQPVQRFAAFPTLDGDTLAFVPYPLAVFVKLRYNPKTDAALRANIETRVAFATEWARQFPGSANAQEALADALEARGDLADDTVRSSAVLRALDSASSFSTDPEQKMRLAASGVRVRFKRGDLEASRRQADSLLQATAVDSIGARQLQWVAALMGRAELTGTMLRSTYPTRSPSGILIPPAVATAASRFFAYAALGICGDQLSSAERAVMTALENEVAVDVRSRLKSELTERALSLAAPCTHGASTLRIQDPVDRLQIAQRAYARRDFRQARATLGVSRTTAEKRRPNDTSLEYLYHGAWLRLQLGDTAIAAAELDGVLAALPTFSAAAFQETAGAASIGRAMALRAELAAKQGDLKVSRHWASAIATLWKTADPALRKSAEWTAAIAPPRQP